MSNQVSNDAWKIVIRLLDQVLNQDKWDTAAAHCTEPNEDTPMSMTYRGPQRIRQWLDEYRLAFPSAQLSVIEHVDAGGQVAVSVHSQQGKSSHEFTIFGHVIDDKLAALRSNPAIPELVQLAAAKRSFSGPPAKGWPASFVRWWSMRLEQLTNLAIVVWRYPKWRNGILVTILLLSAWFGLGHLQRYALRIEYSWLASDIYYFAANPAMRTLSTVSADGNSVIVMADADGFTDGDANGQFDVFLINRKNNKIERVSKAFDGKDSDGWSYDAGISPDGRFVVFSSAARNLMPRAENTNEILAATSASMVKTYLYDVKCQKTYVLNELLEAQKSTSSTAVSSDDCEIENLDVAFLPPSELVSEMWWMTTSRWERLRLLSQHERARGLAQRHLAVVMYYYQQYFASLSLATVAALLAAVCLAYISREGWASTSGYVKAIFTVATITSILFSTIPNLFEFSKNIDNNKRAFVAAATLENQIISYISTGKVLANGTQSSANLVSPNLLPADEFIMRVDRQLVELFGLPVELNPDQIPDASDIFAKLQGDVTAPIVPSPEP